MVLSGHLPSRANTDSPWIVPHFCLLRTSAQSRCSELGCTRTLSQPFPLLRANLPPITGHTGNQIISFLSLATNNSSEFCLRKLHPSPLQGQSRKQLLHTRVGWQFPSPELTSCCLPLCRAKAAVKGSRTRQWHVETLSMCVSQEKTSFSKCRFRGLKEGLMPLLCSIQLHESLKEDNNRGGKDPLLLSCKSDDLQGQHWDFCELTNRTIHWDRGWEISNVFS